MSKRIVFCAMAAVTLSAVSLEADDTSKEATAPDERAAIEKRVQSYVAAYNAKDLQALTSHWAPEGVYIDRTSGERIVGRAALEETFQATFQSQKNDHLDVNVQSIELVSPSVAMEQGTSTITSPDGAPAVSSYSTVHVKRNGQWLIDRISEHEIVPPPSHYEQLKELEWLIGDWTDQAGEGVVSSECHWARNDNFIIRSFTVSIAGDVDMAGMQIIGWDPAKRQIRSWTFDSDGGFNQGIWKKVGESWTMQTTATMPDGKLASSTSLLTPLDENSFTWQQVNRVVGGELLPNLEEIVIVRDSDQ